MKTTTLSLCLAAIVCLCAVTTSCIYDSQTGQLVVTEKVCVNMQQYETDGDISSRAICDKFRERLLDKIDDYGATLDDIDDISVVSAKYKLASLKNTKNDWKVSADIYVRRKDVTDGPEKLISFSNASLKGYKGSFETAALDGDGVALIDRALDDLLDGADPVVIIDVMNTTITPEPTTSNPLQFNWVACVEFQAVVDVSSVD